MSVTSIWLIFTFVSVLGVVGYDVAFKMATVQKADPFVFTTSVAVVAVLAHFLALGVYKVFQPEVTLNMGGSLVWLILAAGIGIVAVDLGFFFAVKHGGLIRTNAAWMISAIIVMTSIGIWVFKEEFNIYNLLGVLLGIFSVVLLMKE